jgi:hypothetical protein
MKRSNGFIIKTEEEEHRLVSLEKRPEPNVDIDDTFQVLGFYLGIKS